MKQLMNKQKAKYMAAGVSLCFLSIHIVLLTFFKRYAVTPMVWINFGSVLFYFAMGTASFLGWFRLYALGTYLEVIFHMSAAVYFTGWEGNFQLSMLGMSILLYFSEYVGKSLKLAHAKSTPFAIIGMAMYLLMCVVSHRHPASYPLPEETIFRLQIIWGAVVFTIVLFFLYIFVRLAAGSEELLSNTVGHDQLTGLPNRYYFVEYLDELTEQEGGLEGHWAAILDIDNFKSINDTYGHNCGDFVLREMAKVLQSSPIRMKVCRWGGEEFLLLGRIENDLEARIAEFEQLRETIMDHSFDYESLHLHLTATIGLADYASDYSVRDWIGMADKRLYEGKTSGKNRVVS